MAFTNVVKQKRLVINKKNKPKVFYLRIGAKNGSCMLSPEFLAPIAGVADSLDFFFDDQTNEFRFRMGVGCATKLKEGGNFTIPSKVARSINARHDKFRLTYPIGYGAYTRSFYYELKMQPDGYWYGSFISRINPNK